MKKTFYFMLFILLITASCKKDDTTTTPTPTPPVEAREKFIGNYHMTDSTWGGGMLNGVYTLDIVISKNASDTSKINILNLNNTGNSATATVSGNIFIITNQQFGTQGNTIGGSGKLENNKLYYDYDFSSFLAVKGVGTKF
jgi:hypothetical protein